MVFQSLLEGGALPPNHLLNADARHAGTRGLAVRSAMRNTFVAMRATLPSQSTSAAKSLPATSGESACSSAVHRRRTAQSGSGCPSFGDQRTLGCRSSATVPGRSNNGAVLHLSCLSFGKAERV